MIAALALAMVPLAACTDTSYGSGYGHARPAAGYPQQDRYHDRRGYDRRDHDHRGHDRGRDGRSYYLGAQDRIYRGRDGNYYCKRSDGTTGAIVGAIAGGVLGNVIAPGGSKTLGTVLGALGGGIAGRAIDKNDVRCE
jgi:hypothetical protein